uniref:Secreted protein n=1 Tax=Globodera pallida TaxID=36090 RepID=A0A183C001_GLOPA
MSWPRLFSTWFINSRPVRPLAFRNGYGWMRLPLFRAMFTDFTQNFPSAGTHDFPNMSVTCFRTGPLLCMSNYGAYHGRD